MRGHDAKVSSGKHQVKKKSARISPDQLSGREVPYDAQFTLPRPQMEPSPKTAE